MIILCLVIASLPDDQNTIIVKQKANDYAVEFVHHIRMKLDGRESIADKKYTIAEHVNWMIETARHPDNLAVLYEGWAPWV